MGRMRSIIRAASCAAAAFTLALAGCGDPLSIVKDVIEKANNPKSTGAPPTAPAISGTIAGSSQVTVSWDAVTDAVSYNLYWAAGSTVTTASGTKVEGATSPAVVSGLTNGTTYAFIVTAVNAYGESDPSSVAMVSPYVQWIPVGNVGFTPDMADYTSLAIDTNGVLYVAFGDNSQSPAYKASVWKYDGSWGVVGNAGFSYGAVEYVSLALDSGGNPVVAFQDHGNAYKATVMYLNAGTWTLYDTGIISSGQANYISMAIATDGTPYVAYQDVANSLMLAVWKYAGGWTNVRPSFGDAVRDTCIATDGSSTVICVYADGAYGNRIGEHLSTNSGVSWSDMGHASGANDTSVSYVSLALSGTTPNVAFMDGYNDINGATVKYNASGWQDRGKDISAGKIAYTSIAFDSSGALYIAYQDESVTDSPRLTVQKYNPSTWSWEVVGAARFSAGSAYYVSLKIYNDIPYVAYEDGGNGYRLTVMAYK